MPDEDLDCCSIFIAELYTMLPEYLGLPWIEGHDARMEEATYQHLLLRKTSPI